MSLGTSWEWDLGFFSFQIFQYFQKVDCTATIPHAAEPQEVSYWGKQEMGTTSYVVTGNGCEHRGTQITLKKGFMYPRPAAMPSTSNIPLKWALCSAPNADSLDRIGSPLPEGFCLLSDHSFQTDTRLNYPLFLNVTKILFTLQRLNPVFTMTQNSVTYDLQLSNSDNIQMQVEGII